MQNDILKKYVDDLNWVNNILHDFVKRVAFMEVAEQYLNKHQLLKENTPFIWSIYNSMANDALLHITNIYDNNSKTVSIHYLFQWVQTNKDLIEKQVHSLDLNLYKKSFQQAKKNLEKFRKINQKI